MDELLADKILYLDDKMFLLHVPKEWRAFTKAVHYGLTIGNGWRTISVKDPEELLRSLDFSSFWILDEKAIKEDKLFDGCRVYCKNFTNPISLGSKYETNVCIYIKEIA